MVVFHKEIEGKCLCPACMVLRGDSKKKKGFSRLNLAVLLRGEYDGTVEGNHTTLFGHGKDGGIITHYGMPCLIRNFKGQIIDSFHNQVPYSACPQYSDSIKLPMEEMGKVFPFWEPPKSLEEVEVVEVAQANSWGGWWNGRAEVLLRHRNNYALLWGQRAPRRFTIVGARLHVSEPRYVEKRGWVRDDWEPSIRTAWKWLSPTGARPKISIGDWCFLPMPTGFKAWRNSVRSPWKTRRRALMKWDERNFRMVETGEYHPFQVSRYWNDEIEWPLTNDYRPTRYAIPRAQVSASRRYKPREDGQLEGVVWGGPVLVRGTVRHSHFGMLRFPKGPRRCHAVYPFRSEVRLLFDPYPKRNWGE